jgi:N-acyl-D-aspartate/D-glutamate deacylase
MDVVLRGAEVVDGTGGPARSADVGISDGRIAAVGEISPSESRGAEVIGLDGLTLAPGFIDSHTHYDCQVMWDGDLTPSSWHGVTSVVMGNCGFGVAPTRPEHQGKILRTLENVEGMALPCLEAGMKWSFETFPEYLDAVERVPKRCNVAAFIGHSPVRLYVMGEAATEREQATAAELAQERAIIEEALAAGAVGLASSKTAAHVGEDGKPVPSGVASEAEIMELARALTRFDHGLFQFAWGADFALDELLEVAASIAPHAVTITPLLDDFVLPLRGQTPTQVLERVAASGLNVWPQVSCRPLKFQLSFEDPFPLAQGMPSFQQVIALPRSDRARLYRDPEWRERAKAETTAMWMPRWGRTTVQETELHTDICNGPTMAELAAARGVDPLDLMLDLALAEGLRTRFLIMLYNYKPENVADLLTSEYTVISLSDGGAHANQFCDSNFATYLLQHWVRERALMSWPEAVHRLTGQPARLYGLTDRGVIQAGAWADLVAFDPDSVGTTEVERVWDLPAGADRLVAYGEGVEHVWVNGTQTRRHGQAIPGPYPGVVIRAGQG